MVPNPRSISTPANRPSVIRPCFESFAGCLLGLVLLHLSQGSLPKPCEPPRGTGPGSDLLI